MCVCVSSTKYWYTYPKHLSVNNVFYICKFYCTCTYYIFFMLKICYYICVFFCLWLGINHMKVNEQKSVKYAVQHADDDIIRTTFEDVSDPHKLYKTDSYSLVCKAHYHGFMHAAKTQLSQRPNKFEFQHNMFSPYQETVTVFNWEIPEHLPDDFFEFFSRLEMLILGSQSQNGPIGNMSQLPSGISKAKHLFVRICLY